MSARCRELKPAAPPTTQLQSTSPPSPSPPTPSHPSTTPANQKSRHRESCTSRSALEPVCDHPRPAPPRSRKTPSHPPEDSPSAKPYPPGTPAESAPVPDSSPPSRRFPSPHESPPAA